MPESLPRSRNGVRLYSLAHFPFQATCSYPVRRTVSFGELWGELSYLYIARACRELGCTSEARDAITILKSRFPDSVSTTRAELLEQEMEGRRVSVGDPLGQESAADALIGAALQKSKEKDYAAAVDILDEVIAAYPHTRRALYAQERRAFILSMKPEHTIASRDGFLDIIEAVQQAAPHSRIRYEAEFRIAALYQRQDQPYDAMVAYLNLADLAQDPRAAVEAAFQAAGAHNELLQKRQSEGDFVSAEEWGDLREHCREVRQRRDASALQRARMDLIIAESLYWQSQLDQALVAAEHVLRTHDRSVDRRGVGTAHVIAGECLFFLHRYEEALAHFEWVLEEFGDEEIWGALKGAHPHRPTHPAELARVHYDIFRTQQKLQIDDAALAQLAEDFLGRFGESRYAAGVRGWYAGYLNLRMREP